MSEDPPQDRPSVSDPGSSPAAQVETETVQRRRRASLRARGSSLVFSGIVLVVAFVLQVADAGYGHDPNRDFAERRPYNTVKRDVHAVLPKAVPLALGGLVLIGLGVHLRKRAERPAAG